MSAAPFLDALILLTCAWGMAVSWRLWRDPKRLHPGHWRYPAIYRRVRDVARRKGGDELTPKEIRRFAIRSTIVCALGVALGVYLLIESLMALAMAL